MRLRSSRELHPLLQNSIWFHGPFETNFVLTRDEGGNLRQVILEYDGVCLKYEPQMEQNEFTAVRSKSACDEAMGYSGVWLENDSQKVSLGSDWRLRLSHRVPQMIRQYPKFDETITTFHKVVQRL